jgi:phosphatidylglycerol:prolipoprotein diacylglycerol transferase
MHAELLHIYGPISIQWYGLMIFIGLLIFSYAFLKNPKRAQLITTDQFFDCITVGIVAAIIGARLLFLFVHRAEIHSFYDCVAIWEGGFSVLGSVLGVLLTIPLYLKVKGINVFNFLDLVAVYIPLLQSISRIGCLFAGCCYGYQTSVCWAIRSDTGVFLHPAQLYSSAALLLMFIFMRYLATVFFKKPGQLMMLYLILESVERFGIDFWRGDREYIEDAGIWSTFSINQYIALGIFVVALIIMIRITVRAQQKDEPV